MTEKVNVNMGENSAEYMAFKVANVIWGHEKEALNQKFTRAYYLDLISECRDAVDGKRSYERR
jgi:hypothetical protein